MAKTKINLVCANCGKEFEHTHFTRNCAESKSYATWAREHVTLCPACYSDSKKSDTHQKLIAELDKHGLALPEIAGVSDKQIAYAQRMRTQALSHELYKLDEYCALMQQLVDEAADIDQLCKAHNLTREQVTRRIIDNAHLTTLWAMLNHTDARDIIDAIK